MQKLINYCVKHHKIIVLATLVVLFFGIYGYRQLPRQENPDISTPIALVSVVFPGASADEVENLVTKPIEDEAAKLEGIDYISSTAGENFSATMVAVDYTVDKEEQFDHLRQYINDLAPTLPSGCQTPVVNTQLFVEPAGMIATITGEGYSHQQLNTYAEELKTHLARVGGLKKTEIQGVPEQRVMVTFSSAELNQYNISVDDIHQVFQAQNVQIPAGSLEGEHGKIKVTVPGTFQNFEDIGNMIIAASPAGGVIRLRDVAQVSLEDDHESKRITSEGQSAVVVASYFEANQNTNLLAPKIDAAIAKTAATLPENVHINKVLYQPDEVENSVSNFVESLIFGVLLVIIVVFFGMGKRNAILVSLSLPISIFATLMLMYLLKMPLHQVSLAGLVIALGMLVDNAIVVTDAVQVRINNGEDKVSAAIHGAMESSAPVFSSTLTTIAAFMTLFALPGEAKEFVQALPVVVIIALIASYLAAMLVVPAVAAYCLVKTQPKPMKLALKVRHYFDQGLAFGMNKPRFLLGVLTAVFVTSLVIGIAVLPLRIFPNVDKDYLYINIYNQEKDNLNTTSAIAAQADEILRTFPQVTKVTYAAGGYLPKLYLTSPMGFDTADFCQVLVEFDLKKDRAYPTREKLRMALQDGLNGKIPSADISVNLFTITMPGPSIDIRFTGDDRQALAVAAQELEDKLATVGGVYNIFDDRTPRKYDYYVNIDDDKATLFGLTRYDIQRQINIALNGAEAGVWRNGPDEHTIYLQSDMMTLTQLENFKIKSSVTDSQVMLRQIGEVTLKTADPSLPRYNRTPSIQVTAEVREGESSQTIQKIVEKEILPTINTDGLQVIFSGEKSTISKYLNGLGIAGLLSLIVIYLILMLQFDSLLKPTIIMATVPLSVIGSIFGLWIFRLPFSFMAGLGIVSLIGVVVNNAILLVEYITRAQDDGDNVRDACQNAVNRRFRPIMLSSVTTIIGLVPLAFSGSSLFSPLAITLMCGLLVSTLLTLIVIPSIYYLLYKNKETPNKKPPSML